MPFSPSSPASARERRQRAGRVLPHALPADEQDAQPRAQPVEVVAAHVGERVERVVEERRFAAVAPGVPGRRVVVAREAERERERVRAPQREVDGVEGAEADAERRDLLRAAAVLVDPRNDLLEDPRLVALVRAGALLERDRGVRPRRAVERVDAVELRPAGVEQARQRADHAAVAVLPRVAALGGEGQERPAVVAVDDHVARAADRGRVQLGVARAHHSAASRPVRCGCSASRQAV